MLLSHADMHRCTHYVRVTPRSIQITWEQPELPSSSDVTVTDYLISYTTTASYIIVVEEWQWMVVYSTASSTLTNLEEDTLYTITVQATTSDNRMSANSNEVSPQDVMVTNVNPASLQISWQP